MALPWWVVADHGSAQALGAVLLAGLIPTLAFTLIGGVAVDRFPRLPLLLGSDAVRGLILVVVTLLAANGALTVWHLVVASFLFGTVDAIFFPAYRAAVRDLTPADLLTSANSLTRLGREATAIGGPLIAATLIALGGTPLAFGLDAVSGPAPDSGRLPACRRGRGSDRARDGFRARWVGERHHHWCRLAPSVDSPP